MKKPSCQQLSVRTVRSRRKTFSSSSYLCYITNKPDVLPLLEQGKPLSARILEAIQRVFSKDFIKFDAKDKGIDIGRIMRLSTINAIAKFSGH